MSGDDTRETLETWSSRRASVDVMPPHRSALVLTEVPQRAPDCTVSGRHTPSLSLVKMSHALACQLVRPFEHIQQTEVDRKPTSWNGHRAICRKTCQRPDEPSDKCGKEGSEQSQA